MDLVRRFIVFAIAVATVPIATMVGTRVSFPVSNRQQAKENLSVTTKTNPASGSTDNTIHQNLTKQ
jgi:hypothetical protein